LAKNMDTLEEIESQSHWNIRYIYLLVIS
jgi:hypothetical protein